MSPIITAVVSAIPALIGALTKGENGGILGKLMGGNNPNSAGTETAQSLGNVFGGGSGLGMSGILAAIFALIGQKKNDNTTNDLADYVDERFAALEDKINQSANTNPYGNMPYPPMPYPGFGAFNVGMPGMPMDGLPAVPPPMAMMPPVRRHIHFHHMPLPGHAVNRILPPGGMGSI